MLWGFMALYLFNISVDPTDIQPGYMPEDLSFNDQESIIEFVVEKVLGYEHAFEEFDDPDTEEHNSAKQVKLELSIPCKDIEQLETFQFVVRRQNFSHDQESLSLGFFEIDTPPPKA